MKQVESARAHQTINKLRITSSVFRSSVRRTFVHASLRTSTLPRTARFFIVWWQFNFMIELEKYFRCPYCFEEISMVLDDSVSEEQNYIEDCEVCCKPISIRFLISDSEITQFSASRLSQVHRRLRLRAALSSSSCAYYSLNFFQN